MTLSYVQTQDLEITEGTQGPVRRCRLCGLTLSFVPCNNHPFAINSTHFSLPLPSNRSQISDVFDPTLHNHLSVRPIPQRVVFRDHKPKRQYPQRCATCGRVSGAALCSFRSRFCCGSWRLVTACARTFAYLRHRPSPHWDNALR